MGEVVNDPWSTPPTAQEVETVVETPVETEDPWGTPPTTAEVEEVSPAPVPTEEPKEETSFLEDAVDFGKKAVQGMYAIARAPSKAVEDFVTDTVETYVSPEKQPSAITQRTEALFNTNSFWSDKDEKTLVEQQEAVKKTLAKEGIEVVTTDTNGKIEKQFRMPDGSLQPYTKSTMQSFYDAKGEIGLGMTGFGIGMKAPGMTKVVAAPALGAIGAGLGADADLVLNSLSTEEKLEDLKYLDNFKRAAKEDAAIGVAASAVLKVGKMMFQGNGEQSLKYLKNYLQLSDDEAKALQQLYSTDPKSAYQTINDKVLALSEGGGPDGLAFLKTALADTESKVGKQAANSYLKQTTERTEAVMEQVRKTNEPLYQVLLKHRKGQGKFHYTDWNAVNKEAEQLVGQGKMAVSETEGRLLDGLASRYADMDSQLFKTAYNRSLPQIHSGTETLQSNFKDAASVKAARSGLQWVIDKLSPTMRENRRVVEIIQETILNNKNPQATIVEMAKGTGEIGKLTKEILRQQKLAKGEEVVTTPPSLGMGNQPAPTSATPRTPSGASPTGDTGYPTPAKAEATEEVVEEGGMTTAEAEIKKRDIDAEDKALKMEAKQAEDDAQAKALIMFKKIKDDNAVAKTIDNAETDEAITALQKIVDDEAVEATIKADAKETLDSLAKQKKEAVAHTKLTVAHDKEMAKITYKAKQHDLKGAKKALEDSEKVGAEFRKEAESYIVKLRKVAQKATKAEKTILAKEIKDTQAKAIKMGKITYKAKQHDLKAAAKQGTVPDVVKTTTQKEGQLKPKTKGEQGLDVPKNPKYADIKLLPPKEPAQKAKALLDKALADGKSIPEATEIYERSIGRSAFDTKESASYTRWMRKNPTKDFHHYATEKELSMKEIKAYYGAKGVDIPKKFLDD